MSAALSPDMSYEEAMARLEEVVSALEEGRRVAARRGANCVAL